MILSVEIYSCSIGRTGMLSAKPVNTAIKQNHGISADCEELLHDINHIIYWLDGYCTYPEFIGYSVCCEYCESVHASSKNKTFK